MPNPQILTVPGLVEGLGRASRRFDKLSDRVRNASGSQRPNHPHPVLAREALGNDRCRPTAPSRSLSLSKGRDERHIASTSSATVYGTPADSGDSTTYVPSLLAKLPKTITAGERHHLGP